MKKRTTAVSGVVGTALIAGFIGIGMAVAAEGTAAQDDYVGPNGVVDLDKVPTSMMVLAPDGNPMIDANGKPVTINARNLYDPAFPDPGQPTQNEPHTLPDLRGPAGSPDAAPGSAPAAPVPVQQLIDTYGSGR